VSLEAIVLGAGPAGSVVARRLAAAGARVALVGSMPRPGIEGVSERSLALLAAEGIEPSALPGPFARGGFWGARAVAGTEWLVRRDRLALALRERAAAHGATLLEGTAVQVSRVREEWRVALRDGSELRAPVLIEARGRRGPEERGPRLLALGRLYRLPRAGAGATHIEPLDFGWCWWARTGAMLWLQIVGRPTQCHPREWTRAAAAQAAQLAGLLEGASAEGPTRACAAHARLTARPPAAGLWYAGDAAMALDPLSGQGIHHSLSSARSVAAAILSVAGGGDPALAQRFIALKDADDFLRSLRVAAGFYRQNAARGDFWGQTAAAYEAAYRARRPHIRGLRIERRPVLLDERIVEREVVVCAAHPRGIWQIAGVSVAQLIREHGESVASERLEQAGSLRSRDTMRI